MENEEMKGNIIEEKSFEFAVQIIELYKRMQSDKEFVISRQVLKSGTSIGANVAEAVEAQSKKDFLSKMNIALKEANETRYWLRLIKFSDIGEYDVESYLTKNNELIKILSSIVKTTKKSLLNGKLKMDN
jgi:four helix bundle protein